MMTSDPNSRTVDDERHEVKSKVDISLFLTINLRKPGEAEEQGKEAEDGDDL